MSSVIPHFSDRNLPLPPWGEHFKGSGDTSKGREPRARLSVPLLGVHTMAVGEPVARPAGRRGARGGLCWPEHKHILALNPNSTPLHPGAGTGAGAARKGGGEWEPGGWTRATSLPVQGSRRGLEGRCPALSALWFGSHGVQSQGPQYLLGVQLTQVLWGKVPCPQFLYSWAPLALEFPSVKYLLFLR